jgi:hypothetical protein
MPEGELMANLKGLSSFVAELKITRKGLVAELRHVDAALSVLAKIGGGNDPKKPRRTMSSAGRKRIAAAQRARWAKIRAAKKKAT